MRGKGASDTFFSATRSVRGYTCVQIFFLLFAHYNYVSLMRREAQSHGALQDFIRNVGAPTALRTDNAQTQVGKKWTESEKKEPDLCLVPTVSF